MAGGPTGRCVHPAAQLFVPPTPTVTARWCRLHRRHRSTRGSWATCTRTSPSTPRRPTRCSQTPDFVEEFILDRTLTPALEAFGLATTTLIDPTCGSGHFLLGGVRPARSGPRREAEPGGEPRVPRQEALDAVTGRGPEPVRGGDRPVPAAGGGMRPRDPRAWPTPRTSGSMWPWATRCCGVRRRAPCRHRGAA